MPNVGDLRVFTGSGWTTISMPPVKYDPASAEFSVDPETFGLPAPLTWDPPEDQKWDELLEILLCPDCEFELGAEACGHNHAYLADQPMQHRLLKPLLEIYLKQIRWTEDGRKCTICSYGDVTIMLATGDCEHPDIRDDQVKLSRAHWEALIGRLGVLYGFEDRLNDLVEDRAAWAEDAVKRVAETAPWNGELHDVFLDDLRAEFRRTA